MPPIIANSAGRCDVFNGVTTSILPSYKVFSRRLAIRQLMLLNAMMLGIRGRIIGPNWLLAVDAALALLLERSASFGFEIGHSQGLLEIDQAKSPVWIIPIAGRRPLSVIGCAPALPRAVRVCSPKQLRLYIYSGAAANPAVSGAQQEQSSAQSSCPLGRLPL